MKLYVVTISTEVVVLAESPRHAERVAQDLRTIDHGEYGYDVAPRSYLSVGWDDDSIPFGHGDDEDPDRTIAQWKERLAEATLPFADAVTRKS